MRKLAIIIFVIIFLPIVINGEIIESHLENDDYLSPNEFKYSSGFNDDIDASYSPIRTTEQNNYYTNTEWSWSDVFSRYTWTQSLVNQPIEEYESIEYWFYVSESNVGSTVVGSMKIDDVNLFYDPDIDLYLYDPLGNLVSASNTYSAWQEEFHEVVYMSGYWLALIDNVENLNGQYDFDRTFIENAKPTVILNQYLEGVYSPFIHETWSFNACESYDDNSIELTFQWRINGEIQSDNDCRILVDEFHELSEYTISVTITDEYGKSASESIIVETNSYPSTKSSLSNISLSLDNIENSQISQRSDMKYVNVPFSSNDFWVVLDMNYNIRTTTNGEVNYYNNIIELNENEEWRLDLEIGNVNADYKLEFKPEIVLWFYFVEDGEWRDLRLPVPSIEPIEAYPNQPSIEFLGQEIYYWEDYIEIPVEYTKDGMTFLLDERVVISQIDLYPFVEELVTKYTGLGTGLSIINFFSDFEIPLSYSIDMTVIGDNYLSVITSLDGAETDIGTEWSEDYLSETHFNSDSIWNDSFPELLNTSIDISRTLNSSVVELNQIALISRDIHSILQPNIDLSFNVLGETLAQFDIYSWEETYTFDSSRYIHPATLHWKWEADYDNDSISDINDDFPFDSTQWLDQDNDGLGSNLSGNNPDFCPDKAGNMSKSGLFGCPDEDGDGVTNDLDDCENTELNDSYISRNGCTNDQVSFFEMEYQVAGNVVQMPVIFGGTSTLIIVILILIFIRRKKSTPVFTQGQTEMGSLNFEQQFNPYLPKLEYQKPIVTNSHYNNYQVQQVNQGLSNLTPHKSLQGQINDDGFEWILHDSKWFWRKSNLEEWIEYKSQ